MIKKLLLLGLFFSLIVFGCKNNTTESDDDGEIVDTSEIEVSAETIQMVITSVPNPVTVSTLLQQSGVIYTSDLLNPVENIDKYTTNFKKALNLGIYGTDLVHMNIYDRTVSTVLYLKNLKDLANDLGLGQFFDYETLNRLSENNKNVDSVLYITSSGFDRMSTFLIEQQRSGIAILISYGTWIESLHLATNIDKITNKKAVYERIGENKEVMDNILLLLSAFKNQSGYKELYEQAEKLKKEFDKVTITIHYAEPTSKVVDGMLVIVDNSTSEINIDDAIVNSIAAQIKEIRNQIIN